MNFKNFPKIFSFVIFLFLVFVRSVFAASINLSSSQTQIGSSDEYLVNVNFSIGSANGTNYFLRGVFYLPGTSNYCGFTYNGLDWFNGPYSNNGWQNLLPITIQNSSWSGTLKAKLDTDDSGCSTSGTYNFKVQRYTQSGSSAFDLQNEQTLNVIVPTPTPTLAPTNTPAPAFTPTPTLKPATISTIKPTVKIYTPTIQISPSSIATISEVLAASSTATPTVIQKIPKFKNQINWLSVVLISIGLVILSACGILFYILWKKGFFLNENSDQ